MAWNIYDPYPADALGNVMAPAAWQHHRNTGVAMELIGPSALGLAAAAIQDLIDVLRPNCAPSSTALFIALVAGSGEGKDTAAAPFVKPIVDFQAEADESFAHALHGYEASLEARRIARRLLAEEMEKDIRDGGTGMAAQQKLAAHLADEPRPPKAPKVIFADATLAAVRTTLCDRWRSGIFFSMEASGLLNGRLGAEFAFWNDGWGGAPIFVDRVLGGARSVSDPRVGMVLGIQPEPFRRFLRRRGSEVHDSGFTARYLMSFPPSTKGTRLIRMQANEKYALQAYGDRVTELLKEGAKRTAAGQPRGKLCLSTPAAAYFVDIYNELQRLMAPGQPYFDISGQAAKAAENVARVAAVLHVIDGMQGDIGYDTIRRAAMIVQWHTDQFMRMFSGEAAVVVANPDADAIESALRSAHQFGYTSIRRADLWKLAPQVKNVKKALQALIARGRVAVVFDQRKTEFVMLTGW
jgi:hypothetical protein